MKKKVIAIVTIIILGIILSMTNSLGAEGSMYLGLRGKSTDRQTGAYTFNSKPIFEIVEYNSSGTVYNEDKSIYCLKGGVGFGSDNYQNNVVEYTQFFDMKKLNLINSPYREQLPTDMAEYNKLVWVLDHIYAKGKTEEESLQSRKQLLDAAGVAQDSFLRNEETYKDEIEDIIESIQQVAIWYFTNPDSEYHNQYTSNIEIWVNGNSLINEYDLDLVDNELNDIYSYLVEGAIEAVKKGYTYEDSIKDPINFNTSSVKAQIEGSNYIVGPYMIQEEGNKEYNLTAQITDGQTDISDNCTILNENKQPITTGNNVSDKINSTIGKEFYISIPVTNKISKIKLEINAETTNITQTMWTTDAGKLDTNQPVVIIDKEKANYPDEHETELPKPEGEYKLKVVKKDKDDKSLLKDAIFSIKINNDEARQCTTNENGEINISGIKITDIENPDTITIEEIQAPNGYIINDEDITLQITKALENGKYIAKSVSGNANITTDPSGINTVNVEIDNTKITGSYNFKLIKEDSKNGNQRLENATFNVTINGTKYSDQKTNGNGELEINNIQITDIEATDTITIEETKAPDGYILNDEIITLNVTKGLNNTQDKYVATNVTGSDNAIIEDNTVKVTIDNTKIEGIYNFKLIKEDSQNEKQKLENAVFKITLNGKEYLDQKTNENGELEINNIQITDIEATDTITIEETKAPDGYILNGDIITLQVTKGLNSTKDAYVVTNVTGSDNAVIEDNTVKININNSRITGSYNFKLIKEDSENGNQKLENAVFSIKINNGAAQEYTTNKNGEIEIRGIQITDINSEDTITIEETKAPDGYILNSETITLKVTKGLNGENNAYIATNVTGSENASLEENTVKITLDNKKLAGSYNFKLIKEDAQDSSIKLKDAVFSIKVNNGEAKEYKTNDNGEIIIEDINITDISTTDTIEIEEVKVPEGYVGNGGKIIVEASKKEENNIYVLDQIISGDATIQSNTIYVTVKNTKLEGSYNLKIIKSDADDPNKKLENAEFNIKISEKTTGTTTETTEITGENGEINISNPITDDGLQITVTIDETKTPEGYDKVLTSPIELYLETGIENGKYIISTAKNISQNADITFDKSTNTITINVTNKRQIFDLALKKYITHINGEPTEESREPKITSEEISNLINGKAGLDNGTTAKKEHTKVPLLVETGDIVRYTIRIYNEGNINGYAKEITDYLPEGLELLSIEESEINKKYGWVSEGQIIKTTYLENTIINKPTNDNINYVDVQIECKVVKEHGIQDISLKNVAEITKQEDILGGQKDIDSNPDNLTENQRNNYNPGTSESGKGYEDDDDYEELIIEGRFFDLSLRKFITGVNEEEITNRIPEVDTSKYGQTGEDGKVVTNFTYNHTKEPVRVSQNDI